MKRITSFIVSSVRSLYRRKTYVNASRYLELLQYARGSTMNEQIEFLTALGVLLSQEGVRELKQLVANDPCFADGKRGSGTAVQANHR